MKVLVLGVSGMLGSTVFRRLSDIQQHEVLGILRNPDIKKYFKQSDSNNIFSDINILDYEKLKNFIIALRPQVIINCVGVIKQLSESQDPLVTLPLNSILPHQLQKIASEIDSRVIQISTDCVFTGKQGHYLESDHADAEDLYGRSKLIGELSEYQNAITLRTSIIGHELISNKSLVDWFLSQTGSVKGYLNAIFSGLPTVELADVIIDYVMKKTDIYGLYHLSAAPINKYELLKLVKNIYKKEIEIIPDDKVRIDRSLNSERFTLATGYKAPDWDKLIHKMYDDYQRRQN